jgi:hypothetical protein
MQELQMKRRGVKDKFALGSLLVAAMPHTSNETDPSSIEAEIGHKDVNQVINALAQKKLETPNPNQEAFFKMVKDGDLIGITQMLYIDQNLVNARDHVK